MGAGKSAVGKQLARNLHLTFADSDDEIESRTGVDSPFLSEQGGDARGFVVYLFTTVEQQVSRTSRGRERPLLEDGNPRDILEKLLETRDPLYREIADLIVNTDGRKVKAVVDEIIEHLE